MGFISDIHGDLRALDAVLDEMKRAGVGEIHAAGDLLLGGDEPLEVWMRLEQVGARCLRGPSDTALATVDPRALSPVGAEEERSADLFARTRAALGDPVLRRLGRLPLRRRLTLACGLELVVVHGSPRDPTIPLSHDLDDDEVRFLLGDEPAAIVVCGASHVAFERVVDGIHIVNVGSVGQSPSGDLATYTFIEDRETGPTVVQGWVEDSRS